MGSIIRCIGRVVYSLVYLNTRIATMGFSIMITETETGNNLFPQWCPLRNREQKRNQFKFLVAPRGRRRLKFTSQFFFFDMSQRIEECVCWNFGLKFSGFHRLKKRVFRRRSVGDLTNLGVKYFTNVCVMYVMMYVLCAGRTDRQVTVKINQIVDLIFLWESNICQMYVSCMS